MTPRFQPGERVRVRAAFPPGVGPDRHYRTPMYCHGKSGVVERICGTFGNPETLAYGGDGKPDRPLYRVRFTQRELWRNGAERGDDTVEIEIFEHWLEAASDD